MWPNKTFIFFKSVFLKTGKAEFEFKSFDGLNDIDYVYYALNVYSRMHALCKKDEVIVFNKLLEEFLFFTKIIGFDEAVSKCDSQQYSLFLETCCFMKNNRESFVFKLNGRHPQSSILKAKTPYKGKISNMSMSLFRMMIFLNKSLSTNSKTLLVKCLTDLNDTLDFINRSYTFWRYFDIPLNILKKNLENK